MIEWDNDGKRWNKYEKYTMRAWKEEALEYTHGLEKEEQWLRSHSIRSLRSCMWVGLQWKGLELQHYLIWITETWLLAE